MTNPGAMAQNVEVTKIEADKDDPSKMKLRLGV